MKNHSWPTIIVALFATACITALAQTASTFHYEIGKPISPDALAYRARFENLIISAGGQHFAWFATKNGVQTAMVTAIGSGHETKLPIPQNLQLRWQHWNRTGEKLYIFAESEQNDMVIYAWDAKTQVLTLQAGESWVQTNSMGSAQNYYAFTIQRFVDKSGTRYTDFDPLSGIMTPVANPVSLIPAYHSKQTTPLALRTLNNISRWIWGDRIIFSPKPIDSRMGFGLMSIAADARKAWFLSAVDQNTQSLAELNLITGHVKTIAKRDADIKTVLLHPTRFTPIAITWERERHQFELLDSSWRKDMVFLQKQLGEPISIINIAPDENYALIEKHTPTAKWYLYNRLAQQLTAINLTDNMPDEGLLAPHGYQFKTRDNLEMTLYLTPPAKNTCNTTQCPMVFLLHGGPAARDFSAANANRNYLASRGYYVAQLNYRGSSGYGKAFQAMDVGNWGLRIQNDLEDGLAAVLRLAPGIAPNRIGLIGGSFSGDMTLNALGRGNEFQCGISIAGTADLLQFVTTTGEKLMGKTDLYHRAGDPRTPAGKLALQNASPLARVDKIKTPVLLMHGEKDKISGVENLTEFAERLAKYGKLSFFILQDEGHNWRRAESTLLEAVLTERFFAKCLGGNQSVTPLPAMDKVKVVFDGNNLLNQKR
jgi:pimeloyl-ACP methyl ester carboxylesterase